MNESKRKKHRKHGRNSRAAKHRAGVTCGVKGCFKLAESRKWNEALQTYIPR